MRTIRRKKFNNLRKGILALILVCGLTTGCRAAENLSETAEKYTSSSDDYGMSSYDVATSDDYEMESNSNVAWSATKSEGSSDKEMSDEGSESAGNNKVNSDSGMNSTQKIIKRYDYRYETERFDDAYEYLKGQIETYNGYISSSEITGSRYDSDYRTLYLTARIPAESSDAFVSDMGQLGVVVRQSESAEDVTLQYSDTESRIESLKTEQESLNKLLEQADSLETIIALQDRLTEVRYELESYESKKKIYDDLISYSTIDITLKEVNYTVEADDGTFFSRIATGLERSLRDIGAGLVGFVEWFIITLPYFILWGVIIFGIVKVCRVLGKKRREKKMKKQQLKAEAAAMNKAENVPVDAVQKSK